MEPESSLPLSQVLCYNISYFFLLWGVVPKVEDHPLSAVHDCLFVCLFFFFFKNLAYLQDNSFILDLRIRHGPPYMG
jgi:hypothetical protein